MDAVKTIVADTYLAYTSDIDGAEAFKRFVSKAEPLLDVRRNPRFSAFTDDKLIDEMVLLEADILILIKCYTKNFMDSLYIVKLLPNGLICSLYNPKYIYEF